MGTNQTQYEAWTDFITNEPYAKFFISNEDQWLDTFRQVQNYIDENQKRPSQQDKNQSVKTLGTWIQNQQHNYKKKQQSMAIQTQYEAWTDFITNEPYAKFFNTQTNNKTNTNNNNTNPKTTQLQRQTYVAPVEMESNEMESLSQKKIRQKSELSQYHAKYTRMYPCNLSAHFKENPNEFVEYHRVRDANFANYNKEDRPYMRIAAELRQIKTNRTRVVVDMGCGLAHLSAELANDERFRFLNYDHVASEKNVISCDIAHLPLKNAEVDVCVLSFALWGPSSIDNLKEAMRILDTGGRLYLIDSTRRWSIPDATTGLIVEGSEGQLLMEMVSNTGFQIVKQHIDKYCMIVCSKP